MDYDNNGVMDFISGSYDPGSIYLFRGLGEGRYAAVEALTDETGADVVHHPVEFREWKAITDPDKQNDDIGIRLRVASFGSWPAMVDWDNDGDLDILIGTFAGGLVLRKNIGTRSEPVWSGEAVTVEAAGEPVNVKSHAAPVVADWDDDGSWDLVVGAGDGSVGWLRNTAESGSPTFEGIRPLVFAASADKFLEQTLKPGESPFHGTRAQICVTDYNGDGWLDLILGDYSDINTLKELDESETEALAKLDSQRTTMISQVRRLQAKFADDWKNEEFQSERKRFSEMFEQLEQERKEYFSESRRASFIWLFLRQESPQYSRLAAPIQEPDDKSSAEAAAPVESTDADGISRTAQLEMTAIAEPVEGSDHEFDVSVTIQIARGWHLYDKVPVDGIHKPVTLRLEHPESVTLSGEWQHSRGTPDPRNPEETIHQNLATFTQRVRLEEKASSATVKVIADYEVCNESFCLPPGTLRVKCVVDR